MSRRLLSFKAIRELKLFAAIPATADFLFGYDNSDSETKRISSDKVKFNTTGWNDLLFPSVSTGKGAANNPTMKTFRGNIQALAFAGTGSMEEAFFSIHIPHDHKVGTKVYPHVHWTHIIGSPSGSVVWQLDYTSSEGHSVNTYPAPTTVALAAIVAPAQYTHVITEFSDAQAFITNLEPDSVVLCRIFRDPAHGSDTFENDAFLIHIDFHYESDLIFTNEKVSPFTKSQI
jgi:hypothetical protein